MGTKRCRGFLPSTICKLERKKIHTVVPGETWKLWSDLNCMIDHQKKIETCMKKGTLVPWDVRTKVLGSHIWHQLLNANHRQMNRHFQLFRDWRKVVGIKSLLGRQQLENPNLVLNRPHIRCLDQVVVSHILHDWEQDISVPQGMTYIFGCKGLVFVGYNNGTNAALCHPLLDGRLHPPMLSNTIKVRHSKGSKTFFFFWAGLLWRERPKACSKSQLCLQDRIHARNQIKLISFFDAPPT